MRRTKPLRLFRLLEFPLRSSRDPKTRRFRSRNSCARVKNRESAYESGPVRQSRLVPAATDLCESSLQLCSLARRSLRRISPPIRPPLPYLSLSPSPSVARTTATTSEEATSRHSSRNARGNSPPRAWGTFTAGTSPRRVRARGEGPRDLAAALRSSGPASPRTRGRGGAFATTYAQALSRQCARELRPFPLSSGEERNGTERWRAAGHPRRWGCGPSRLRYAPARV